MYVIIFFKLNLSARVRTYHQECNHKNVCIILILKYLTLVIESPT